MGVFALARPLSAALAVLKDPDTYLHIAAGQWVIAHAALPVRDPFSHTMAGAPWIPHEWLSEVLLAGVYALAGWPGLVLLTALCFAGALALLTRALLRCWEPFSALIVVGLSGALLSSHLLARPHVLALPILVAWCAALVRARDDGRAPPLLVLPLMTLWANLHGGFMVGLALAGFLGVEAAWASTTRQQRWRSLRQWGGFVALGTIAALLTPNGIHGLLLPFHLLSMPTLQQSFSEWQSASFQRFEPLEAWLLAMMFAAFAVGLRLPIPRLLLLLAMIHLALAHVRHADLVALVAPLVVSSSLGPQLAARIRATPSSTLGERVAALASPANAAGVALTTAIVCVVGLLTLLRPIERPDGPETPGAALAAAAKIGVSGPVLNSESFGGYLIFRGVPTFIDGRIEMYGDPFLRRYLAIDHGVTPALGEALKQYGITWTLLHPQDGAVAALDHLPGWRRAYTGPDAVIHIRARAP
ncbi:MAG TPA: hypothetical protein VFK49_01545 [Stellaceae bacterium]|nr:hypothetical protein [Stellaceae bacterium]